MNIENHFHGNNNIIIIQQVVKEMNEKEQSTLPVTKPKFDWKKFWNKLGGIVTWLLRFAIIPFIPNSS